MANITEALQQFGNEINPFGAELVAISKTKPVSDIMEAYTWGHRHFGENKVQELVDKYQQLPQDIHWHMVGHLQRNKVKYIAEFVYLIHSVDSQKLLKEINKQGRKVDRKIPVLLQVHIAREETKFGFDEDEVLELMASQELKSFDHVIIRGLMGMATNTRDDHIVSKEFAGLKRLFERIKSGDYPNSGIDHLSMGMTGDYKIALEHGSSLIRVGSAIFGARN